MVCLYQAERFPVKLTRSIARRDYRRKSADEIRSQTREGADEFGFDFIEHDGSTTLPQTVERPFHNDLCAIMDGCFPEPDDLDGASTGFQQKTIGVLTISSGGRLQVGHFSHHSHRLFVVLVRMGQQIGELHDASRLEARWRSEADQNGTESEKQL